MTYNRQTQAYRDTEVMGASPARLVPLIYKNLLVNLKRGSAFMREGDIPGKHQALTLAGDLVYELLSALDFEKGGDIAPRLASLYAFWAREISEAGFRMEPERIDRVAAMVADLHESWAEAARIAEAGGGAA